MSEAGTLLRAAAADLRAAGIAAPERDARRLLAHALEIDPARLALADGPVPPEAAARFAAAVAARRSGQPVAQITGRRAFWGRSFRVTPDVLDPRPETETLVAAALEAPFRRVLDLGTGSGCLLLTLLAERPEATGLGIDASGAALAVARDNAARLGLADRAAFRPGDWAGGLDGDFDLIVSNPPYVTEADWAGLAREVRDWEPRSALVGGADGLEAYRAILRDVPRLLADGGRLILEVGAGQAPEVADLCRSAGLGATGERADLDGRARAVVAARP